jgi:hypothetical protein
MWGLMLAKNEKKRKRDREIQDIFAAFNMGAVELFNRIIQQDNIPRLNREAINTILEGILTEFTALVELINEAFKKSSIAYKYIVPQIVHYDGIKYKNFFNEVKAAKPKRAPSNPLKNIVIDPDADSDKDSDKDSDNESDSGDDE